MSDNLNFDNTGFDFSSYNDIKTQNDFWGFDSTGTGLSQIDTFERDIKDLVDIIGYIAGRKNTLSPHFDQEKAVKMYKEEFASRVPKGAKSLTLDNGEVIKGSFSQKNFIALFGQGEFDKLNDGTFYKLNVKEGNPEYLVLDSRVVQDGPGYIQDKLSKNADASSADSDIIVIKPKKLGEVLYAVGATGYVYIKDTMGVETFGIMSPKKTNKYNNKGELKIKIRYFAKDATGYRVVPQLGVIKGLPYAVNKSYEGQAVTGPVNLVNREQIEARYPELLDKISQIKMTAPRETTKGVPQEIDFSAYVDEYSKMGVTTAMLDKLRKSKSSGGTKEFTLADIIASYNGEI